MRKRDAETLFERSANEGAPPPLSERMRPRRLEDMVGQAKALGDAARETPLRRAIREDRLRSLILWGPPGSGKTTLGHVIAAQTKSCFVPFSAVLGSVPELRQIVAEAKERRAYRGERTLVFVDEIHRFNRAQQDAFLPHVEDGTLTLIGATTENPSFAVNAALLSRCQVVRLEPLGEEELGLLVRRAARSEAPSVTLTEEAVREISSSARGDARRALSLLEGTLASAQSSGDPVVDADAVRALEGRRPLLYDKTGEEHYNVTSAFIKSLRGSDADAAIYWMMRMLEAGDDPLFVLRRMLIFASEDIGNADPRALVLVSSADAAFRRLGMPEGMYPMAHAALYLAAAPKSNACNLAWHRAKALVDKHGALPVPHKLRNAVTPLMKREGYGDGYAYAHDHEAGFVPGETYLPDALVGTPLYEPTTHGEEARMGERLRRVRGAQRQT